MGTKKFNRNFLIAMIVIIVVMYLTSLDDIQLFFKPHITLWIIPIALSAIVVGPTGGLICGTVYAVCKIYRILLKLHLLTIFTMLPIPLTGLFTGLIFKALHNKKMKKSCYYISAFCCPMLYILLLRVVDIFYNVQYIQDLVARFTNPFFFFINFIGVSEFINVIICSILISVILRGLQDILEQQAYMKLVEKIPLKYKICANCKKYSNKSKEDFYENETMSKFAMLYMSGKKITKADDYSENSFGYCTYFDIDTNANKVCNKFEPPVQLIEKYNK